jgi:hypothetical protein
MSQYLKPRKASSFCSTVSEALQLVLYTLVAHIVENLLAKKKNLNLRNEE